MAELCARRQSSMAELDLTRALKAAGIAWTLGVASFVSAFLLPTSNPDLVANTVLFCAGFWIIGIEYLAAVALYSYCAKPSYKAIPNETRAPAAEAK